ncbi:FMN-dependent NADH-azoreductase [Pseudoteredinibacter isoporae]|uniref:FMN dependent NADH:quinone oxidoreductase n=1 Tax=Pseudoteredinibacter isoporae TaxID=570281 RepID=A0A7X0JTN9_9GAMM|nr:NAD(P)H-dependent oxidoreductase [Pseudoteredinibacter isoporae]MBB6521528.1 FMN-dependent NADH-azoreductase [Pseudoteredinibacter isoporae]NHO87082.1 ACP phosphodiesterase [Pseudoteredinibacter isoporae]NIB22829.1 ACP phosphodiesterase [Pseudoteredinibacter isoporae]
MTILHIDSSAQLDNSNSRQLGQYLVQKLAQTAVHRDLAQKPPLVPSAEDLMDFKDGKTAPRDSLEAYYQQSEEFILELKAADVLVIGAGMYNFSVPAYLKLWIDAICRAGETFRYTSEGPEGLSGIKTAYIITATGGTPVGSPYDFCSGYLEQVCRFIGVKDIHHIDASGSKGSQDAILAAGREDIDQLLSKQ